MYSPSAPAEGQPVTFSVNASSAIGGSLTYQWSFQCSIPSGGPTSGSPPPCFFAPPATATGNPVTYTFPVNGIYGVSVMVTDSAGKQASAGLQVDVAHVPPALVVYPACDPFLICPVSNVFEVPLGTATTLGGCVVHAGTTDQDVVNIDWGDGTNGDADMFPANSSTQADGIHLPFLGTHQYAAAGDYTVNVKVADQSGGTATQTVTEHVVISSTTSTTTGPTTTSSPSTLSTTTTTLPPSSTCGNGQVESGEQCDDGNTVAGDCYSPTCQIEADGTACGRDQDACAASVCRAGLCTVAAATSLSSTDCRLTALQAALLSNTSGGIQTTLLHTLTLAIDRLRQADEFVAAGDIRHATSRS